MGFSGDVATSRGGSQTCEKKLGESVAKPRSSAGEAARGGRGLGGRRGPSVVEILRSMAGREAWKRVLQRRWRSLSSKRRRGWITVAIDRAGGGGAKGETLTDGGFGLWGVGR